MTTLVEALLATRRVVVCAGPGGVGKTTVAATLALLGVMARKNVLCLTIDPARRLANSLGLPRVSSELHEVERGALERLGIEEPGRLAVVMLEPKSVFDSLVKRHAASSASQRRILENKLYRYLSSHLAGVQSYMAMEKVLEAKQDKAYDLIVLDTPPTSEALDFLRAPERLVETLDSPAMRWLIDAFDPRRRFSFNLLARGAALGLRGLSRVTGQGFLESVAELVAGLEELFGGFRARAQQMSQAFRGPEFGYVLVTAPRQGATREAAFLANRLAEEGLSLDLVVVNRVRQEPPRVYEEGERIAALEELGLRPTEALLAKLERADEQGRLEAERDAAERLNFMRQATSLSVPPGRIIQLPAFGQGVHDLHMLRRVADKLNLATE